MNPAERGPRTGVARGGSVRKHRDVVPQTKVTVSSKGPKVVKASEELPGRRPDALQGNSAAAQRARACDE